MKYTAHYMSPLGEMLLACDDEGLTGLWFEGQKYYASGLNPDAEDRDTAFFTEAKRWLDIYFSGKSPDFVPQLHLCGTDYQVKVWEYLLSIPYGTTVTYGQIARDMNRGGAGSLAARAVGSAVGHNRISVIVPCHRVLGAGGALTGYAGGTERKTALLQLEGAAWKYK